MKKGFTLVEVMFTMIVLGLVFILLLSILQYTNNSYTYTKDKGFIQHDRRITSEVIKDELRTAKTISETEPVISKYYSMEFTDEKALIYKEHSSEGITILNRVEGPIENIVFIHEGSSGMMKALLTYSEGRHTENYMLEFKIENTKYINETFSTNKIYFTRYGD